MRDGRMNSLATRTILGFAQLILALALVIFVAAGTLDFWQAWLYLAVFAISSGLITIYLWLHDPHLLERRVRAGPVAEQQRSQRIIQLCAAVTFLAIFVVSGLDHRYGWSSVPLAVVILGACLVTLGFYIVLVVFKENTFTSATIEVAADQTVVSTGPYALVRHPMYSGALVMLVGTPLTLGSWWGLLPVLVMGVVIVWRLLDEERLLARTLRGYTDYRQQVRFRLVPFVW
ncbi:MAG TPA: isoprenylcysteine carboxylmethyltransferase family protein [Chloroflexota bacterium]|jgi:protein-S-isoprenylcysteine O-methyltransferase Ste14|nr:isoprenylcysteine carboxylmethyltransferase family protein [Chloroflexota bacterium]